MDDYEDYPNLYNKIEISTSVKLFDSDKIETHDSFIYVMQKGYTYQKPSEKYIQKCREGFIDFNIPVSGLEDALEKIA